VPSLVPFTTEDFQRIAQGLNNCSRIDEGDENDVVSAELLRAGLGDLRAAIDSASNAGAWRKGRVDLFSILERRNREDLRSNVLAWLLDPDESHGCQDQLVRRLLEHIRVTKTGSGRVNVAREYWLSQNRRVDIFVKVEEVHIAIEK
jgi:hypothetical protein